jgi:hypothetical protein
MIGIGFIPETTTSFIGNDQDRKDMSKYLAQTSPPTYRDTVVLTRLE